MRSRRFVQLAAVLVPLLALGASVQFGPNDVATVFAIGKSDDGNEVQYAVRLDDTCALVGKEPVFGYWRLHDEGPGVTKTMSFMDQFGYGISSQKVASDRQSVTIQLKTASGHPIDIHTRREGGRCVATPLATIGGERAELQRIFLQLSGPLSVAWVSISGVSLTGREKRSERLTQ